jgi:hypothetical protein
MVERWRKNRVQTDERTDRQTDGQTDRVNEFNRAIFFQKYALKTIYCIVPKTSINFFFYIKLF